MAAMQRGDIDVDMRTVGEHQGRPRDETTPGIIIGTMLTVLIFGLIMVVFMPLGQFLGLILNQARQPLLAYSVNIAASLAGMWAVCHA